MTGGDDSTRHAPRRHSGSAWPFLTGRARSTGHRDIVLPAILSGTPFAGKLSSLVGSGQHSYAEMPGEAVICKLAGPGSGQWTAGLYAVFRRYRPRAADFGVGGDEPLLDGSSRPIAMTEGLLIEGPRLPDLTTADMAAAHAEVLPAFQRFWHEEGQFARACSRPLELTNRGAPLPVRDMHGKPVPPGSLLAGPPPATNPPDPPGVPPAPDPPVPVPGKARRRRWPAAVAGGAAGVAVTVAVISAIIPRPEASWKVVQETAPGTTLTAVTEAGPGSVWVGGWHQSGGTTVPVAERRNGRHWIQAPFPPGTRGRVTLLQAGPSGGAWAVVSRGQDSPATLFQSAGRSWTARPPEVPPGTSAMTAGQDGVWLFSQRPGLDALYYSGRLAVPVPVPEPATGITSTATASAGDGWAAGALPGQQPVIYQWSGAGWTTVRPPLLGPAPRGAVDSIVAVCVVPGHGLWVAGNDTGSRRTVPDIQQYDGTAWRRVPLSASWKITAAAPDGTGALWLAAAPAASQGNSRIFRYSGGTFTSARISGPPVTAFAAGSGTSEAWAVSAHTVFSYTSGT